MPSASGATPGRRGVVLAPPAGSTSRRPSACERSRSGGSLVASRCSSAGASAAMRWPSWPACRCGRREDASSRTRKVTGLDPGLFWREEKRQGGQGVWLKDESPSPPPHGPTGPSWAARTTPLQSSRLRRSSWACTTAARPPPSSRLLRAGRPSRAEDVWAFLAVRPSAAPCGIPRPRRREGHAGPGMAPHSRAPVSSR